MIWPLILGACSVACSFGAGWYWGTRHCARKYHCLVQQIHDTKEWTGELHRAQVARLMKRERDRATEDKGDPIR